MRISLHYVLQNLPVGASYEESLEIIPQAKSWLIKEKERLEQMYAFQESFWPINSGAGCDEVGRGPLAGPLGAAAVILPNHTWIPGLNDSKKLSEEVRELLVPWIKKTANWSICEISLAELDKINNINRTSLLAMHRSLDQLSPKAQFVFIDGRSEMASCPVPQVAIIKGDARIPAIAASSIIAKVYRDHLLDQAHNQWPQYKFKENKGYGTAAHMQALHKFGPCPYHRRTFAPIKQLLEANQAIQEQAVLF